MPFLLYVVLKKKSSSGLFPVPIPINTLTTSCQIHPHRHTAANTEISLCFRPFFNNQAHSDVVLRCNGQQFYAHRLVLAAQSKTFDRMLQTQMREGASGEVEIDGMQPDVLALLLKYIYGCHEGITPASVVDLFRAADHYQVSGRALCAVKECTLCCAPRWRGFEQSAWI